MGDDSASPPESTFGGLFDAARSARTRVAGTAAERPAAPIATPTPAAAAAEDSLFDDAGEHGR